MHKIYFCLSNFYTLEDSAWCYSIHILTIGDFNSFGFFWDTLYYKWYKTSIALTEEKMLSLLYCTLLLRYVDTVAIARREQRQSKQRRGVSTSHTNQWNVS